MEYYIRTDTSNDLVSTLELALEFLVKASTDDRYWKWVVYAFHSAVQSTAALALEGGNGFLVQKPDTMRRMLAAPASPSGPVEPHMDNFGRLINKTITQANLYPGAIALQDSDLVRVLESLDELRDEFVHFNVKSWSIERAHLFRCLIGALEYIHHYICVTPAFLWHEDAIQLRARSATLNLRDRLGQLYGIE
ncbi:MAG: hypothetical protein WAW73_09675 [Rhodoferax sp.]